MLASGANLDPSVFLGAAASVRMECCIAYRTMLTNYFAPHAGGISAGR
jgi:hypothetical protein